MNDFEILSHTADLKIRAYGKTMPDLFLHALIGMFQAIEPVVSGCARKNNRLICSVLPVRHTIHVSSGDREGLLVDFLSEALYLSDVHNQAYLDAMITSLTDTEIEATLFGVQVRGFDVEIKAVTYHDLKIKCINGIWQTEIVFDI